MFVLIQTAESFKMQSVVARHEMLRWEAIRFGTFFNWNKALGAWKLVRAGFYYNDRRDEVICFSCGLILTGWKKDDDPMQDHEEFMADCPFIKGLDKSIPMACTQISGLSPAQMAERPPIDASLLHDELKIIQSYKKRFYADQTVVFPMRITIPEVNVPGSIMDVDAFFAKMSLPVNIRNTFEACAQYMFLNIDKETLVDAGFFRLVFNECVQCFACRCIISNLIDGDNPTERHFQVSPSCPFIRKVLELDPAPAGEPIVDTTCKICLYRRVNTTLVPCGHCFCEICIVPIATSKKCAICRTGIRFHHNLFLI